MKTVEDLANRIIIDEPKLKGLLNDLSYDDMVGIYLKLEEYFRRLDVRAELEARADLSDDTNIETAILKHLASLDYPEQAEALAELVEDYADAFFQINYETEPMLDAFERYERDHNLIKE